MWAHRRGRCLSLAGSLPVRVPQRASLEVRGERFERGVAFGSESVPSSRGVGHFGVPRLLVNHDLQILSDGPAFGGRARRVVSDHAGGFPVAGQHDFRG